MIVRLRNAVMLCVRGRHQIRSIVVGPAWSLRKTNQAYAAPSLSVRGPGQPSGAFWAACR
jgi:hypothetical protein